jgi:NDP-sugar pyrophosphorylase family protein
MKAMILAAGLGTRLRPLTEDRPKALVQVGGRTLLEITLARLRRIGIQDVIINVHHFAGMMVDYLNTNHNFGMNVEISREEVLLDTGGGLKQAADFFLKHSAGPDEPFLLHNVDVISTIDFSRMLQFHDERRALATLAVQDRRTSRYLLFDENGELCGRQAGKNSEPELVRNSKPVQAFAFCGVHVISSRFLRLLTEQGTFSIIEPYLRLAAVGERILSFRADEYYWRDLGRPENLAQAAEDLRQKAIVL